jgi:hypothetical protein
MSVSRASLHTVSALCLVLAAGAARSQQLDCEKVKSSTVPFQLTNETTIRWPAGNSSGVVFEQVFRGADGRSVSYVLSGAKGALPTRRTSVRGRTVEEISHPLNRAVTLRLTPDYGGVDPKILAWEKDGAYSVLETQTEDYGGGQETRTTTRTRFEDKIVGIEKVYVEPCAVSVVHVSRRTALEDLGPEAKPEVRAEFEKAKQNGTVARSSVELYYSFDLGARLRFSSSATSDKGVFSTTSAASKIELSFTPVHDYRGFASDRRGMQNLTHLHRPP